MRNVLDLQRLTVANEDAEVLVQSDVSDHCSGVVPSTESAHCTGTEQL
mgnify:CR=1 FL=1